jgi:D-tyrosyl-tRNA(Tyr) deacylase
MFNEKIKNYNIKIAEGIFGADMCVEICNDGPITIMLDSKELIKN